MFQLLRSADRELVAQQLPVFAISFIAASLFYKFGSFALECLAFLATWLVLDLVVTLLVVCRRFGFSQYSARGTQVTLSDAHEATEPNSATQH